MESSTIRGAGKLFFCDYIEDGENSRRAREFFQLLSEEFIHTSMRYYNQIAEHPFAYKERQSSSYILPTFSKITDGAILAEQPITRNRGAESEEDGHGYLDYWAWFRNIAFAIEVKHGFFSINAGKTRTDVIGKWQDASNQLRGVKKEDITNRGYSFVKMSLLIMPLYKSSTSGELDTEVWSDIGMFKDLTKQLREDLVIEPNIFSYWALKDGIQKVCYSDESGDRQEIYPAVALIGRIDSV